MPVADERPEAARIRRDPKLGTAPVSSLHAVAEGLKEGSGTQTLCGGGLDRAYQSEWNPRNMKPSGHGYGAGFPAGAGSPHFLFGGGKSAMEGVDHARGEEGLVLWHRIDFRR